ncbi:Aste57867_13345 [Aphanomyces stellatus]|uniref:Aste57867_13345 protein n=1 Tax=Aphanomyces stellatus TaxID=120398 RepID=A0A485KYD9_9STRA|nr:hypothetical protein As57867_013295 [Aphanomyces stellatus]VFT90184.1 Aste57867_13345 [Aphanomyces stellatus]
MSSRGDDKSLSGILSRMATFSFSLSESEGPQSTTQATPGSNDRPLQVPQEVHLKIALVGGNGVGKSSIVRRWLKRPYQAAYHQTIGVDVHTIKYPYKEKDSSLYLHIWDVSSAEVDSPSFHELLCDRLDGVFFVFNVHRVSSIAAVDAWRTRLGQYISASETPFYLLSHKADMLQKRVMTSDDIEAYARTAGYKGWCWTVGRGGLGENERNPPVLEALDKMVDYICRGKSMTELLHDRYHQPSTTDILKRMEPGVVPSVESMPFSSAVLHVPTQAITTMPRPGEEDKSGGFGGDWMFGEQKGQYLVVNSRESVDLSETDSEEPSVDAAPDIATIAEHDDGWKYFAGSIERTKAERLLGGLFEGAFLVRRKDSRTLVLSYKGHDDVHHVLIEYHDEKYHVGAKAPNQPAFSTLAKCLRSVRKYANKGLTFQRAPRRLQVGQRTTMDLVVDDAGDARRGKETTWMASVTRRRESTQMEAPQASVAVPPKQRLVEMARDFYARAKARLSEIEAHATDLTQLRELRTMVDTEERENTVSDDESHNALEDCWRKLVKDMESWNQILATLEINTP